MTIITPEQETEDSAEILRGLQEAIGALRREIEGLTEQTRSGGNSRKLRCLATRPKWRACWHIA